MAVAYVSEHHLREHLFTAAVYYFLKQFFFYPSTCVPPTQPAQPGCFVSAMCLMFSLFHTVFTEENCNLVRSGMDSSVTAPTYKLKSGD